MDDIAELEVARMLNAFPMGNSNPDLTMQTYELATQGFSPTAVIEAAQRFIMGDVEGQSKTFAPSVAEFVQEARKRQEFMDLRARPRIAATGYVRADHLRPFEILRQKALTKFQDCPIIAENISHAEFMALSKARQIPVGGGWSAATGNCYGPPFEEISKGIRNVA